MNKILSLNLGRMDNGTAGSFFEAIKKIAVASAVINQKFKKVLDAFVAAYENYEVKLAGHRFNLLTEELQKADAARDGVYRLIRSMIRDYRSFPDEVKRAAAEILWKITEEYGNLANMKYKKQTGLMTNFIFDLQQNHAAELETLEITALVERLKTENENYKRIEMERFESVAGKENEEVASARRALHDAYRNLVLVVNAGVVLDGEEEYSEFINLVNSVVRSYRIQLGQGSGTPDATPEEEEEELEAEEEEEEEEQGGATNGKKETKWFGPNGELLHTQYYEVGEHIVPPEPPAGYIWNYHPNYMPDENLTINCLKDE